MLAARSDDGELQILGHNHQETFAFAEDRIRGCVSGLRGWNCFPVDLASGTIESQVQVSMFGCGTGAFSPGGGYLITQSNGGLPKNGET